MISSPSAGWPAWPRRRPSSPRWPWQSRPLRPLRPSRGPTGFIRDGDQPHRQHHNRRDPSPATIDATGYDIGVYFSPGHVRAP